MNKLNQRIKKETAKINQKSWNEKMTSLNVDDQSLYQISKCLKKKSNPLPPLKSTNGSIAFSDKAKADLIADSFFKAHEIPETPTRHTLSVKNSVDKINNSEVDFPDHERVTLNELKSLIKELNVKKACGYDDISNRVLKNFPECALKLLVDTFNNCLRVGYFPLDWKIGKIVAIPKPDKDQTLPTSYRPITLLPVIGKVFEKVILTRLREHEEDSQFLKNQQFGFRSKHSTTQQILRITETVSIRYNENKSTALTTLDLEKAFDKVWHDALIHKLEMYGFPTYLIKIVFSFLRQRKSFVIINGKKSYRFAVHAGVPQGSPLSPFLFTVFINDIPVPKHCKIAVFADDTALLSSISNYNLPVLIKRMEDGLNEIARHFSEWKVKLNAQKTESILFSHSRKMKQLCDTQKINFDGANLEWKNTLRYLGIWFDPKLTFCSNTDKNVAKAKKAMAILYPLLKKNSGVNRHSKITLYRSYIRPILTYACPVFDNAAKTHIKKLQTVQNKCLRMVLNARFRTRITTLHERTNLPMIDKFIGKLSDSFYKNAERSKNKLISRLGDYTRLPSNFHQKHKLPRNVTH
jgi:hypothetical protein